MDEKERAEVELKPTSLDELRERATKLEQLPSGLVFRIRKVNNFMLAQLPLPEEAVRIARETGDPRKAEAALTTSDSIALMQQLIHVGTLEPPLAMPLGAVELARLEPGQLPPATVDDLDNKDFMALYRAICRWGGLEPLEVQPFPESPADPGGGHDGHQVAGGRDAPGLSAAAPGGVDAAAADPDGGGDQGK